MKTALLTILVLGGFSFNSSAAITCKSLVTGQNLKKPELVLSKYHESIGYIRGVDRTSLIEITTAISRTDLNDFVRLVPKETFPKEDRRLSKPKLVEFSEGLRTSRPDPLRNNLKLYFPTTLKHAAQLKSGRAKLKLSADYSTYAALPLVDRGSSLFADKIDNRKYAIIETFIHPKARILDITHYSLGDRGPTQYSYHASYKWFTDVFVPDLVSGKYKDQLPELTAVAQKNEYDFQRVEIFGLLMKADIVYLSQRGGPLNRQGYWVINPEAVVGFTQFR